MSQTEIGILKSLDDQVIKQVVDFVYLGSHAQSSEKDINTRIAKSWTALNKLTCIWKSNLPDNLKRNFFKAVVESVLLYGSTTWTLTKAMEKNLDGTYTRRAQSPLVKTSNTSAAIW